MRDADVRAAREHLHALYGDIDVGYAILWIKDTKTSECFDLSVEGALDRMAAQAIVHSQRHDVYFNICLAGTPIPSTQRGTADGMVVIPGVR